MKSQDEDGERGNEASYDPSGESQKKTEENYFKKYPMDLGRKKGLR